MTSYNFDRTRPAVHLRINGERLNSGSGGTFDHINPVTGQVDATIPLAGPDEVDLAVAAAHSAYLKWRHTRPSERRRLLLRLADLIEANKHEFLRRAAMDNGTAIGQMQSNIAAAAERTRYYAGFADKFSGRVASTYDVDGEFSYTIGQPYGVIGVIITWNGPLGSLTMKVPAALAAGNTVVAKPSEMTPFIGELFADLVEQAGFPTGVFNILPGSAAAGSRLVDHPLVKKISFTGGPVTGSRILQSCATQFKPAVMELGGKSANLVFADADLDQAVQFGTFRVLGLQSGQGCAFPTRMLVQSEVYDEVVERVIRVASTIKVGDPFDPSIDTGPVINADAVDRILSMVQRAQENGARLVHGGKKIMTDGLADGYFIEPTVLVDVDPRSEMGQEEVFGPVLSIIRFDTEEEAVAIANDTSFGLAAYIQTNNLRRAHRIAEALDAGVVAINGAPTQMLNRPFGGFGDSGYGKENGPEGIAEFLRTKAIALG